MPRVNNVDTKAETPLPQLQKSLAELQPGQKVYINNTREELSKIRENLYKKRHEIPGADDHIEYIEAVFMAEANNQLEFKK